MEIRVDRVGGIQAIYGEAIDLGQLGVVMIRRASYVEPDAEGRWWADLASVQGPRMGPFRRRTEALAAEEEWLLGHWGNW